MYDLPGNVTTDEMANDAITNAVNNFILGRMFFFSGL